MRRALISAVAIAIIALSATVSANDPEPLTLSAVSNRTTCTLGSVTTIDYTIEGGVPPYRLTVDGREVATGTDPGLIRCNDSAIGSPFESTRGVGTRYIPFNVRDSAGASVYKVVEVRLVPLLPAPIDLRVTSEVTWASDVNLSARWSVPYLPHERRTEDFAIRWRVEGASEWIVEHHRGTQGPVFTYRDVWQVDAPHTGERRELQVAQLRDVLDLHGPQSLLWSTSSQVTTAAHPYELQAEATHDTITIRWGPHPRGLTYRADLRVVNSGSYGAHERIVVADGPPYVSRFVDLLPDTLYRLNVCLIPTNQDYCWPTRQNEFELRTDEAPKGWSPPTRVATEIQAVYVDGEIEVMWVPPETGSRYESKVCVRQSTQDGYGNTCEVVPPGQARARLPFQYDWSSGQYVISVSTRTLPVGTAEAVVLLRTYAPDLPIEGDPPAPPHFIAWSWRQYQRGSAAVWAFEWDEQGSDLSELSWYYNDRRHVREEHYGRASLTSLHGQAPETVRVRLLHDGAWTPWSEPADVPNVTRPARISNIDEWRDHIEVHWHPPEHGGDVVGYRLYVTRNDSREEVVDVGLQTSTKILIMENDRRYQLRVAPLTEEGFEVGSSYPDWYLRGPLELELTVSHNDSSCLNGTATFLEMVWSIYRGASPFILSINDRLGFETDKRFGSSRIDCRIGVDGRLHEIQASVMDAYGRTAASTLVASYSSTPISDPDVDELPVRLSSRSVHRDHVRLSWSCQYRPYTAVLRWRIAEHVEWSYVEDFSQMRYHDRRCRGTWEGLQPTTRYEYQVARVDRQRESRRLEDLQWSKTQTVTTLGEPQGLELERIGETVTVSWERQPDAWAYVVGLRAEGRSWWKRYEPGGELREAVRFFNVPEDLDLSVELISPPLDDGEEARPDGYDYVELGH